MARVRPSNRLMWPRKSPPLLGLRSIRCLGAISDAASLAATLTASKLPASRPLRSPCGFSPAKTRTPGYRLGTGRLVPCGRTPAAALEPGRIAIAGRYRRGFSRAIHLGRLSLAYRCGRYSNSPAVPAYRGADLAASATSDSGDRSTAAAHRVDTGVPSRNAWRVERFHRSRSEPAAEERYRATRMPSSCCSTPSRPSWRTQGGYCSI